MHDPLVIYSTLQYWGLHIYDLTKWSPLVKAILRLFETYEYCWMGTGYKEKKTPILFQVYVPRFK